MIDITVLERTTSWNIHVKKICKNFMNNRYNCRKMKRKMESFVHKFYEFYLILYNFLRIIRRIEFFFEHVGTNLLFNRGECW